MAESTGIAEQDIRNELGSSGGLEEGFLNAEESKDKINLLQKEINRLNETLKEDDLTKLTNRRETESYIKDQLALKKKLAILFIDADYFKAVNDTFGHDTGDTILQILALRLKTHIPKKDVVGRWGGEEFVVVMSDIDLDTAKSRAEELREVIAKNPILVEPNQAINQTISIGVAISKPEDDWLTFVKRADRAMYSAKSAGRNNVKTELDAYSSSTAH